MKCCDLTAGMLRHTIEIIEQVRAPDGLGGVALTWATKLTAKAKIQPTGGGESYRFDRIDGVVTHKVFMRYVAGITAADRVRFGGRDFRILAALNLEERNLWLELRCDEREAEG